MGDTRQRKVSEEDALKEAEETLKIIEKAQEESGEAKSENGEAQADNQAKNVKTEVKKTTKVGKAKVRSQKYKSVFEKVDRNRLYSIDDAIELVKNTSYSKFDGSIECNLRLEKVKKGETIRGLIQLPHKAGKEIKVGIIDEALVAKILQDKKTEYDLLLASPEMMPKIARAAKILGPQGKMPNPKSGTVTKDPQKTMAEIKSGRTEYKADDYGIIHLNIGKVSWDKSKILENYNTFRNAFGGQKLRSVTLSATMGPGVKVQL